MNIAQVNHSGRQAFNRRLGPAHRPPLGVGEGGMKGARVEVAVSVSQLSISADKQYVTIPPLAFYSQLQSVSYSHHEHVSVITFTG